MVGSAALHVAGGSQPAQERKWGRGATVLSAQGGAYGISDIIVQEQGDLVIISPAAALPRVAGPRLECNNYCLHHCIHCSMGTAVPSWFCPGSELPPLLQVISLTMVGNSFSWS